MIRQLVWSRVSQRRKPVLEIRCVCPALYRVLWMPPDHSVLLIGWGLRAAKVEKCLFVHLLRPVQSLGCTSWFYGRKRWYEGKALSAAVSIAGPSINNLQTQAKEPCEGSRSLCSERLARMRHSGNSICLV